MGKACRGSLMIQGRIEIGIDHAHDETWSGGKWEETKRTHVSGVAARERTRIWRARLHGRELIKCAAAME